MRRALLALVACLALARPAAAGDVLFRVFLVDGTSLVSVGELARVQDQVVLAMPVGGPVDDPRVHAVTLASSLVDWPRTDRHAASTRYLKYFDTRAEADFERLTTEVAASLNEIARSPDRAAALAQAEGTRRLLADWPRTHFGYRQNEVRDIVTHLDDAISRLRGTKTIELSLFAGVPATPLEPLATMPTVREQLDQLLHVLRATRLGRDRVALIQAALVLVGEAGAAAAVDSRRMQQQLQAQLRDELAIDARYARLTERLLGEAVRAAAAANIRNVEKTLSRIDREDARLGRRRPDVIQSVRASVQGQLDRARQLRLLRDQWQLRQQIYRDYQRTVRSQMLQLVKAQAALEAIRSLDGPSPRNVLDLYARLRGGADRLERIPIPEYLRPTHQLLVGAWRFAETATRTRYDAATSGNVTTAWQASSAAAGALMTFSRVQQELRVFLEPPKLQ